MLERVDGGAAADGVWEVGAAARVATSTAAEAAAIVRRAHHPSVATSSGPTAVDGVGAIAVDRLRRVGAELERDGRLGPNVIAAPTEA